jgi:hypothetical protein
MQLKKSRHPNGAVYHGWDVHDSRITGLGFTDEIAAQV